MTTHCFRKLYGSLAVGLLVFSWIVSGSVTSPAQAKPVPNRQLASPELNARVEALLKKMTLEEKVGQLAQFAEGYATGPGA